MVRMNPNRWVTLDIVAAWVQGEIAKGRGGHVVAMSSDPEGNDFRLLEPNEGFWTEEVLDVAGVEGNVLGLVLWPAQRIEIKEVAS